MSTPNLPALGVTLSAIARLCAAEARVSGREPGNFRPIVPDPWDLAEYERMMAAPATPILLSVDMGEGGPVSDYVRTMAEAETALFRALAVPPEMLTGEPGSYAATRAHFEIREKMLRGIL